MAHEHKGEVLLKKVVFLHVCTEQPYISPITNLLDEPPILKHLLNVAGKTYEGDRLLTNTNKLSIC